MLVGLILDRFFIFEPKPFNELSEFGATLSENTYKNHATFTRFLVEFAGQVGTKWDQQSTKKKNMLEFWTTSVMDLNRFGLNMAQSCPNLASKLGVLVTPFEAFLQTFWSLDLLLWLGWCQDGLESPQEDFRDRLWRHFGCFWFVSLAFSFLYIILVILCVILVIFLSLLDTF